MRTPHNHPFLVESAGPNVPPAMIVILVSWVGAIFASFNVNAPWHATMHAVHSFDLP
jgi:hypothetical protein